MTAAVNNLKIEQGATYRQLLTVKDDQGVAINITGCTFRGALKKTPGTAVLATFEFTADSGNPDVVDADPALGKIYMVLSPAQSALLPTVGATTYKSVFTFQYDVEMTDSIGNVFRILNGSADVSPEITT